MGGNELSLASIWQRLAFASLLMGFQMVILAFATDHQALGEGNVKVEVFLLIGFFCYLFALIFSILLIWLAEQLDDHNVLWTSLPMVLSFLAALTIIIGMAIEGAAHLLLPTYATFFILFGALLAIISGVWLAMQVRTNFVGGWSPS